MEIILMMRITVSYDPKYGYLLKCKGNLVSQL